MIKKIVSRVFLVIVSIAILQILGTIILARHLPKPQMGLYRLILTIIDLGTLVSLMGIDQSFVRFFSHPQVSLDKYNWKQFLKKTSPFSLLLIILMTSSVSLLYKFPPLVTISILIMLVTLTLIFIFSSFLRAQQRYVTAIFLNRINFLIFFIFLLILYFSKGIGFTNALLCYTAALILANIIVTCYALKNTSCGNTPIPLSVLKSGIYYFGMGASTILIMQTSYLFIGKMLSYKDLAVYAIIASLMRLFEFVQDALYYVLAPHLNKKTDIPAKKIFSALLSLGLIIALIYLLAGKAIIHFLFNGLYDEGVYLIPIFVGIGIVRTLYILPASILGGRTSEQTLRNQFYITVSAAIINIYLTYIFISKWQLQGAALASLITWSLLFILASNATKKHIVYNEGNYVSSI